MSFLLFRKGWRRAFALCLPLTLVAQPPTPQPLADEQELRIGVTVKYVTVPVTVTDKDGNIINGLQPKDFRLYDNEKPQAITEDVTFHPVSMVIAIQKSAGVEGILPKIHKIGNLLENQIIGETGEAAVLSFDHRIEVLQEFTREAGKITEAVRKIKPGSTSARMNDATITAINMLRNKPTGRRRVILLISQTRDVSSEMSAKQVLTEAQFKDVIIYSVNINRFMSAWTNRNPTPPRPPAVPPTAQGRIGNGGAMTPTTQAQVMTGNLMPGFVEIFKQVKGLFIDNPLEVYTKWTGGREYDFVTEAALQRAINDIGEEIHAQYLLTYRLPENVEGGYHNIRVDVLREGLKVRARAGYWVAGPQSEEESKKKRK
jgi:VWFA-related protein